MQRKTTNMSDATSTSQGVNIPGAASVVETNAGGRADTPMGKKAQYAGRNAIYAQPIIQDKVANDRDMPGVDCWTVYPSEYAKFGIGPDEEHCWRRNPDMWEGDEKSNRLLQSMRESPGLVACLKDDGSFYQVGDQVLCKRPRTDPEVAARQSKAECDAYIKGIKTGEVDPSVPRFKREELGESDRVEQEHDMHVKLGIIGPTSGLNYTDQLATERGRAQIERLETQARNGGHHYSASEIETVYAKQQERMENAGKAIARAKAGTNFPSGSIPSKIGRQRPPEFAAAVAASKNRR